MRNFAHGCNGTIVLGREGKFSNTPRRSAVGTFEANITASSARVRFESDFLYFQYSAVTKIFFVKSAD